ncbi:Bax inhibitor-1/YccA family protein [Ruicaihuangia caeni]|uniref:Bax inhibitor-1/YccA family protein n=1 Tax=Ruicaihuangia caeni TaxID=3042517 RepID=A0AAW6T997_9MICO|nr:Bax inhibitor-1/YccA family protein [Klugiella sp. YN-L-19]MDI2098635.1 Bax inhibitor-1/YccA family protein [Klugiella sp. YN-L-19]
MANPAFSNSPAFSGKAPSMTVEQLNELYGRPSATDQDRPAGTAPLAPAAPVLPEAERMTYEDTIMKIVISFGVLLLGAAVGWFVPVLALPAALVGLVLGFVNVFKKQPSRGLILAYAAVEGVFVGGISYLFSTMWEGIVTQALLGTLAVVGVTLALFASGKVRATPKLTRIFLVAMIGYAAFSLVNFGLMIFGVTDGMFGLRSVEFLGLPLGAWLGVLVVLLAAYSLVMDFENIKTGVERGVPRVYGWQAAFGILVTVVWLYLEILRLIAILRGSE